jgi:hypothetical protein
MIEPPGDFGRRRIFEVDNRVLIAGKFALVEQRSGPVHKPVVIVCRILVDALAMKPRKQRSGAGSVEALVVIEDFNPQPPQLLEPESGKAGRLRIMRQADCVKEPEYRT